VNFEIFSEKIDLILCQDIVDYQFSIYNWPQRRAAIGPRQ